MGRVEAGARLRQRGAGNQNATPTFDQHSAEEEKVGHPPGRGLDALPAIVLYFAWAPGALVRKT